MLLNSRLVFVACFILFSFVGLCPAFYLPGAAPVTYCDDSREPSCQSQLRVFVNRLNTVKNILPYEYAQFDFCVLEDYEDYSTSENLGEMVFGERIRPSPYLMNFSQAVDCRTVCKKTYKPGDKSSLERLTFLKRGISLNYQHHWMVDDLPMVWCYKVESGETYCANGFPIGCQVTKSGSRKDACVIQADFKVPDTYYVFNHVDIVIQYHPMRDEGRRHSANREPQLGRIISARVSFRSIDHSKEGPNEACSIYSPVFGIPGGKFEKDITIKYTYSVVWEVNTEIKWSSRWDYILDSMPHTNIHWFSIVNSLWVVVFLSGVLAKIMYHILRKDLAHINQENPKALPGWKLVHGDVFRPPRNGMFLAVLVGNGCQLFFMSLITLVFACLGFLSPANRGALMTCAMMSYVFVGTPAGYISARFYKTFGGEKWKSNAILTAVFCPGVVFAMAFQLNLVLWAKHSSAAIPFSTLVALLALWFGISVPLTFIGAYFGFRKKPIEHPVATNEIPRPIPEQGRRLCSRPLPGIILGGVLPFGCIFIQLFFILNSIWSHQFYYMFGFLFMVFITFIITCSEATILLCYFHLRAQDYHWWWRSFLTSGFTAFYVFLYSIHFFVTKLEIEDLTSTVLYFGYTLIIVFLFFIFTGFIGFLSCFWFVSKIYSVVKVDPTTAEKTYLLLTSEKGLELAGKSSSSAGLEEVTGICQGPKNKYLWLSEALTSTGQPEKDKLDLNRPEQRSDLCVHCPPGAAKFQENKSSDDA